MFGLGNILSLIFQHKTTILYFLVFCLMAALALVVVKRFHLLSRLDNSRYQTSLDDLKAELGNLKQNQQVVNNKLQSLNTRVKYGQIKSDAQDLPFSRSTMENTPFFNVIGAGLLHNLSADDELSPTNCQPNIYESFEKRDGNPFVCDPDMSQHVAKVTELSSVELPSPIDLPDIQENNLPGISDSSLPNQSQIDSIISPSEKIVGDNGIQSADIDDVIEDDIIEDDVIENDVIENDVIDDDVIDDGVIEEMTENPCYLSDVHSGASIKTENLVLKGSIIDKPILKLKTC